MSCVKCPIPNYTDCPVCSQNWTKGRTFQDVFLLSLDRLGYLVAAILATAQQADVITGHKFSTMHSAYAKQPWESLLRPFHLFLPPDFVLPLYHPFIHPSIKSGSNILIFSQASNQPWSPIPTSMDGYVNPLLLTRQSVHVDSLCGQTNAHVPANDMSRNKQHCNGL